MVNSNLALNYSIPENATKEVQIKDDPLKWCSVSLSDVIARGSRLDASVYDTVAKQDRHNIENGKYPYTQLYGNEYCPVTNAYYGSRMKRNYVPASNSKAIGFLGSSEMLDIYPKPVKFMEDTDRVSDLHVSFGTILLSLSGTIGNLTFVSKTLSKYLVSEHAIRLTCAEYPGYVYTFLKTKSGQALLHSNIFGAVIQEIEPEHLKNIPIPSAPENLKDEINSLIVRSFELRDESNDLLDKANGLLIKELELPLIEEFQQHAVYYQKNAPVDTFSVKLSNLDGRLDGSYHVPVVDAIVDHLKQHAAEVTTVGDSRISDRVVLPIRFKRIYVEEGYGRVLIGGKQIYELDPSNKKYISIAKHKDLIPDLEIHENTVLITRSGTIGKVAIAPRHWEKWVPSDHIIRVFPANDDIAGYLYVYLLSDYGHELITRYTYGSVVDEIDDNHVSRIAFPILKNQDVQNEINSLALEANEKRYQAYKLEQEALKKMDEEVIYAK